jgi:hypothetical protein
MIEGYGVFLILALLGCVVYALEETTIAGNDYTTFSLRSESGEGVNIFLWGHQNLKAGQKVKVIGLYKKVKKVGRYTFYNEIEASEIKLYFKR